MRELDPFLTPHTEVDVIRDVFDWKHTILCLCMLGSKQIVLSCILSNCDSPWTSDFQWFFSPTPDNKDNSCYVGYLLKTEGKIILFIKGQREITISISGCVYIRGVASVEYAPNSGAFSGAHDMQA